MAEQCPMKPSQRGADGDDASDGIESQDLVHDGQHRVEIVVDDDDRCPGGRQRGDEVVELLTASGIDGAGRLIEDEELRAHGQSDGDREPVAPPA